MRRVAPGSRGRGAVRRRARRAAAGLAAVLVSAGAQAQEQDDLRHDGTWTGSTRCGAVPCDVRVVVAEFGGTWQDVSRKPARQRLCAGRPLPLTVQRSDETQLVFTVWGSSVAAGCPDLTVRTKPDGPRTLTGTLQTGPHGPESAAQVAVSSVGGPSASAAGAVSIALQRRAGR